MTYLNLVYVFEIYFLSLAEITPDYSAKLLNIAEGVKSGSLKYEEEFIVDHKANTARLIVYLNGEVVRDHGVIKGDQEIDNISDDGRQTKVSNGCVFMQCA